MVKIRKNGIARPATKGFISKTQLNLTKLDDIGQLKNRNFYRNVDMAPPELKALWREKIQYVNRKRYMKITLPEIPKPKNKEEDDVD